MRDNIKGGDVAVFSLFQGLDDKNNLRGLYDGRLRSRQRDVEGIKRKWEELTGQSVPKRLKTDEFQEMEEARVAAAAKPAAKPAKTKPASKPPVKPPSDTLSPSAVGSLAYNDIRKELKQRNISCVGKKTELAERLVKALNKERAREETIRKKEMLGLGKAEKKDVVMEEDKEPTKEKNVAVPAEKSAVAISAPKSALKSSKYAVKPSVLSSPSLAKNGYKPGQSVTKLKEPTPTKLAVKETPKLATKETPKPPVKEAKPPNESIPALTKVSSGSDSSTDNSSSSKASVASKPPVASCKTNSAVKMIEKKKAVAASKESRAAKLAEMRERVKNGKTTSVSSATKTYTPSTSVASAVSKLQSASKPTESKGLSTLAKMREQVAAEKASTVKPTVKPISSLSSFKLTPQFQPSPHKKKTPSPLKVPSPLQQVNDPANRVPSPLKVSPAPMKPSPVKELSPMQTYEMSDREESSSDEESDDESRDDKPKKAIPEWAQRSNLNAALQKQFADGPNRLDPDKIFGEVETCNLEQIFGDVKTKKRYHKRTSSGNWTKDHVTVAEKLAYKRTMGYDR